EGREEGREEGRKERGERRGRTVPLGRPLGHAEVYVLDEEGRIAPVGVKGEIYIGGGGVGRGYVGKAGETAERYVPDGVSGKSGRRLYRSGDEGRWLEGGEVEYLGRK